MSQNNSKETKQVESFSPIYESLKQGCIFNIQECVFVDKDESFKISDFYPKTNGVKNKYAMVINQTCDLSKEPDENGNLRDPAEKIPYLVVGFLEPVFDVLKQDPEVYQRLKRQIEYQEIIPNPGDEEIFDNIPTKFYSFSKLFKSLTEKSENKDIQILINKLAGIINNNHKWMFFVELTPGEFYIFNISKTFPLKMDHYKEVFKSTEYQLKAEYENNLGWRMASLYGRVALDVYSTEDKVRLTTGILSKLAENDYPDAISTDSEKISKLKSRIKEYSNSRTGIDKLIDTVTSITEEKK